MRWHVLSRPNPLVLAGALLLLAGIGVTVEQWLQRRALALHQTRTAYATALAATRTQLAGLLHDAIGDQTLTHNLQWDLAHSVRATLAGRLQKGSLDQLSLTDNACKTIASASLDKLIPVTAACQEQPMQDLKAKDIREGFFWYEYEDQPVLGLVANLAGSKPNSSSSKDHPRYAIALVVLSNNWLSLYPNLKEQIQLLKLKLGQESSDATTLLREGITASDKALAALTSNSNVNALLIHRALNPAAVIDKKNWLWVCLLFAFACLLQAGWSQRQNRTRLNRELQALTRWSQTQAQSMTSILSPSTPNDESTFAEVKLAMMQALQARGETIRTLMQQRDALNAAVQLRDEQLAKLNSRLSERAELDSLAMQMARTCDSFLSRMKSLHDKAEDLGDVLGGGIAERSKHLFNILMEWQEGVAERGARKFVRSLAESAGEAEGSSLLDEHLVAMAMLAGDICDLAINASLETHHLLESTGFAAQIAGYWHSLAAKIDDDVLCTDLLDALEHAQNLMRQVKRYELMPFANRIEANNAISLPSIPLISWTTGLYHALMAVAQAASPGATIVSRLRLGQGENKALLVLQAHEPAASPSALVTQQLKPDRRTEDLEVARAIFAPYAVSVTTLPTLEGPFPVVLSWPHFSAGLPQVDHGKLGRTAEISDPQKTI